MTSHRVNHGGIRFACETRGVGSDLILLHGLGGDRSQALDLVGDVDWRRLAIDLRAHGQTEPIGAADAFTFSGFAEDVLAILDDHGMEQVVVVGISMGAGVAARLALDHPSRVRALVAIRPAWLDQPFAENLEAFPEIAGLLRRLGPAAGLAAFRDSAVYSRIDATSKVAAESLCGQFAKPKAVERAVRLERMPGSVPFLDRAGLGKVRVRSLVIGCERDPLHPMSIAETWARTLGDSRLAIVASKTVSETRHSSEIRSELAGFLEHLRE